MLIWTGWAIALVAGCLLGWGWHAWRVPEDSRQDWKTRLAAREADVRTAREETAEVTIRLNRTLEELEAVRSEAAAPEGEPSPEHVKALEEELARSEQRIAELTANRGDGAACPDPAAHASPDPVTDPLTWQSGNVVHLAGRRTAPSPASGPGAATATAVPSDDLTLIPGIDETVAAALVEIGITTFRDIAALDPDDSALLDGFATEVGADREAWADAARRLHEEHHGETI